MGESDFPYRRGCSLRQPKVTRKAGEVTRVSQTYLMTWLLSPMPRQTEELEEYIWVSQTYLRTWLLSPMPEANRGAGGIHMGESELLGDLAALFYSPMATGGW